MAEHVYLKGDLVAKFEAIVGKTLEEADVYGFFEKLRSVKLQKGVVGAFIEQCVLGYDPDPKQEPDLSVIDGGAKVKTELKSTGMVLQKKPHTHFEAKEPMSVTAVGVYDMAEETFETSHFWNKAEHMLLVYYLYLADKPVQPYEYRKFPVVGYEFHEFTEEEKAALKQDWEYVHALICRVISHHPGPKTKAWKEAVKKEYIEVHGELRRLLSYIDLAPKFPPRFRLKRPMVSSIIANRFGYTLGGLPDRYTVVSDIDKKCRELTDKYKGMTIAEIADVLGLGGIKPVKAAAERLIVAMFGGKASKLNQIEIFRRFGLIAKTVTTTPQGSHTEDMKLFHIDFKEVVAEEVVGDEGTIRPIRFEDSEFYSYFADHEFLCILFQEPQAGSACSLTQNKFVGFKRLVFSDKFIYGKVQKLWLDTRDKIIGGKLADVPRKSVGTKTGEAGSAPNFIKASQNDVFIRGGGINSSKEHKTETVNGIAMLPQYVWIKGKAIVEELKHTPQL